MFAMSEAEPYHDMPAIIAKYHLANRAASDQQSSVDVNISQCSSLPAF
jgi:hypothetical protein